MEDEHKEQSKLQNLVNLQLGNGAMGRLLVFLILPSKHILYPPIHDLSHLLSGGLRQWLTSEWLHILGLCQFIVSNVHEEGKLIIGGPGGPGQTFSRLKFFCVYIFMRVYVYTITRIL